MKFSRYMRDTLVSATSIQKTVGNLFSIRLLIGVISDLVATKRALLVSALTYLYALIRFCNLTVEMRGFEPLTPCLQGRCSPN